MGVDHENHRESTHGINISDSLAHHKNRAKVRNIFENYKYIIIKKVNGITVHLD